ncbi:hypothetical protein AC578_7295 [Pseudocercospora eumusae]|uniref:Zn(2)-C6 fungal-type domain-containing protein n=1 Tax=Pseudocercospora eumusae TaxID=321146 RepID=A0A139HWI9_9PEZI|nr:hypothetical protein AC578_7295 [Pseudocercospora eumusae]
MEMKRRRVTQACDRCRALKSKCDGLQPVCGRCKAYGYHCTWQTGRRRGFPNGDVSPSQTDSVSNPDIEALRQGIRAYDELLVNMRAKMPDASLAAVDLSLARIRMGLPGEVLEGRPQSMDSQESIPAILKRHYSENDADERYLGEASDVRFVHALQDLLHISNPHTPPDPTNQVGSYEKEARSGGEMEHLRPPDMPTREEADRYVEIYFSTVHVAYPFLYQPGFRQKYDDFWKTQSARDVSPQFFCTMLAVFALGSLYTMFSSKASLRTGAHERLYEQSWTLAKKLDSGHGRNSVCMLLVQCFYLFASCQTERCWTTLGVALKIAQCLGLHVEEEHPPRRQSTTSKIERELRRRAWHACYVLDCMLSLQTGRPQMVRIRDTAINLPHPLDDSQWNFEPDMIPTPSSEPQHVDYFASEVRLSCIVEQIIMDLYGPRRAMSEQVNLAPVELLDRRLLQWRHELPRHLRFDLGHAFERSLVFRKQRNMLGIKYHYLRALIHRPHLCIKWLKADAYGTISTSSRIAQQVLASERICIAEAQETARMLHHINNEQDIIHDYPWWHMVPCLLCACSILLVTSKWAAVHSNLEVPREVLEDDAAVCLRVFDALGKHFDAARLAGDMMRALQSQQFPIKNSLTFPGSRPGSHAGRGSQTEHAPLTPITNADMGLQMRAAIAANLQGHHHVEGGPIDVWSEWPCELSDSLLWSQQFVLPTDNSSAEAPWEPPPGHDQ